MEAPDVDAMAAAASLRGYTFFHYVIIHFFWAGSSAGPVFQKYAMYNLQDFSCDSMLGKNDMG